MSQTETRPGFRLPWSAERTEPEQPAAEPAAEPAVEPAVEVTVEPEQSAAEPAVEPAVEVTVADDPTPTEELVTPDMIDTTGPIAAQGRRPTKFMADLSRAMQIAAESSRDETLARLSADAKTFVDEIHAGSTVESAALRRRADDDVAAVREWSKAEIARVRDETEARIAARKVALDGEMEVHAATVDARAQRLTARVADFETEMAGFFERLLAEKDPTRIATMAETMPDPPDLAGIASSIAEPVLEPFDPISARMAAWSVVEPDGRQTEETPEATSEATSDEASEATDAAAPASLDFAAAEAEAATFSGTLEDDEGLDSIKTEEATVPAAAESAAEPAANTERLTTRVVVLGLVSVASIANFKRSLGRVTGVSAIGVASGPDGEFVFTVSHDANLGLAGAISALPGFDAQVTAESADGLEVAAHDPDAGN